MTGILEVGCRAGGKQSGRAVQADAVAVDWTKGQDVVVNQIAYKSQAISDAILYTCKFDEVSLMRYYLHNCDADCHLFLRRASNAVCTDTSATTPSSLS